MIDAPALTVPVAIFVKHKVEQSSLGKAKREERFSKLAEAVDEKEIKINDGGLTKRTDPVPSPSPVTDIPSDNKPT